MARVVRLSDEVYRTLIESMHEGETEAEAIRRLAGPRAASPKSPAHPLPRPPTTMELGWVTELDRPKE